MEEIKNNETETVKNDSPKPGTKAFIEAENAALKAELEAMKAQKADEAETINLEFSKTRGINTGVRVDTWEPKGSEEKMVKIRIPRTKADQEDVFVSVNLRTWAIKRGVEVEVPECVAEVLRHQEEVLEEIMIFDEAHKKGN